MPPKTESQSGTRTDVLSGTPARVEVVCTQSEDLGNALPSRFRHCAVLRHSHTLSAWSSEFEVCHAAFLAVKNESDAACVTTLNTCTITMYLQEWNTWVPTKIVNLKFIIYGLRGRNDYKL